MAATEQQAPSLKPGTRLLGYNVLGLLAQGGMAEVYLARRSGNPPVVIKRIRPNLVEDQQFVRMFVDEARLAQMLNHPNVVKVLEVGTDDGIYALAMEFLDGRNLLRVARACYQRRAYVPYELMGRIVMDSLAGLDHAHTQRGPDGQPMNMVHRDMSPENIVVTYDGRVKVVDFGIAKAANMEGRTQVGVIKGKLGYVAPEAISGDKLDGRADIFAMGVTLYELLTYTVPFAGSNEVEVLTAISTRDPASPRTLNPSVPQPLEEICMRALEKNRQKRWQSAPEMRNALETFVRSTGKGTSNQHLGVFMDALFPKGTDKDRVRVGELLLLPEPEDGPPSGSRSRTPAANMPRVSSPRGATQPAAAKAAAGKQSGPAWSKALQIEAMMDNNPSPPRGSPRPAPAPAAGKKNAPKNNDAKTDAIELSSEQMDDLREASNAEREINTGDVEVFDVTDDGGGPPSEGATRLEDRATVEAALRGMTVETDLDQRTLVGEAPLPKQRFPEPPNSAPRGRGPPPPPGSNAPSSLISKKGRLPPEPPMPDAPLPARPITAATRTPVRAGIPPPPDFLSSPPKAPYEISEPQLEPVDAMEEVHAPPPEPVRARPAPSPRPPVDDSPMPPALETQESDILTPPAMPKKRMNPVLAMMLGMMLALFITAGAVAAAVFAGVAQVHLPAELGGMHFPESPTSPAAPRPVP